MIFFPTCFFFLFANFFIPSSVIGCCRKCTGPRFSTLEPLSAMDLDEEDSEEEEEATPPVATKVRVEDFDEQFSSNIVVGV